MDILYGSPRAYLEEFYQRNMIVKTCRVTFHPRIKRQGFSRSRYALIDNSWESSWSS
ncbi:hypothetical protein SAMD00079811_14450 [Scytonema sp. HK-05]|nr:hypothetical protein SAMD00079811_14450 [Scytonema sp. HK-05]